jgi:hypothetical protein
MKNKILPITISILLIGLLLLPLTVLAKGVSPTATVVPASLQPTSPSIVTALKGEDINPQDVEQLTPTTFYDLKTGNHFALLPAELSGNNASANQSDGNDPSTTFYPDAYPESTCMDGFIELGGDYDTWNDIVTSGSGMADSDDTTSSGQIIYIAAAGSSDHWDADIRDYYLFDTSSLGSNVTVTSATLGIYT